MDERLHQLMLPFDDYQDALRAGAVLKADSVEHLAVQTGLPLKTLAATLKSVEACVLRQARDPFGRDFRGKPPLAPPYRAAKVTGALFHTQGGLVVDRDARVLHPDGRPFPNIFAGGGAARGISSGGASGYMAGNGLVTATTLGKLAGRAAARQIKSPFPPRGGRVQRFSPAAMALGITLSSQSGLGSPMRTITRSRARET
jgi:fumarate reductase flavoprotein subunit